MNDYGESDLIPGLASMQITVSSLKHITVEDLWRMKEPLSGVIAQNKALAIHQEGHRTKTAKISFDGSKLCLHVLRENIIPSDVHFIEHREALKLIYPSPTLTFIDLGLNGSVLGRMYVRLSPASQATKQFSALCTGETGYSYLETNIIDVWQKDREKEYVQLGDYEDNNGSGGKALFPGLGDTEEYNRPWIAGNVWGFLSRASVAAQFHILTRNNPGQVVCAPSFGMVESGLNILQNVVRCCSDINNVVIADCGVVLPTSLSN